MKSATHHKYRDYWHFPHNVLTLFLGTLLIFLFQLEGYIPIVKLHLLGWKSHGSINCFSFQSPTSCHTFCHRISKPWATPWARWYSSLIQTQPIGLPRAGKLVMVQVAAVFTATVLRAVVITTHLTTKFLISRPDGMAPWYESGLWGCHRSEIWQQDEWWLPWLQDLQIVSVSPVAMPPNFWPHGPGGMAPWAGSLTSQVYSFPCPNCGLFR